jgi:hypothetical protein
VSSFTKTDAGIVFYNIEVIVFRFQQIAEKTKKNIPCVKVKFAHGAEHLIRRRYSEILALHDSLRKLSPVISGLSFPSKTLGAVDKVTIIKNRQGKFDEYLAKVTFHDIFWQSNEHAA